jgi:hypothetical protein
MSNLNVCRIDKIDTKEENIVEEEEYLNTDDNDYNIISITHKGRTSDSKKK